MIFPGLVGIMGSFNSSWWLSNVVSLFCNVSIIYFAFSSRWNYLYSKWGVFEKKQDKDDSAEV